MSDAVCIDPFKPGVPISGCAMHSHLKCIQGNRRDSHRRDCHCHQRDRHLLSGCQKHIHFPSRCVRIDLFCFRDQFIRCISHSGKHNDHIVAFFVFFHTAFCHIKDPFPVCNRTASKFFHDQHTILLQKGARSDGTPLLL